jgi:hypothetical protein
MVVSGGKMYCENRMLSKPTTESCCGTLIFSA